MTITTTFRKLAEIAEKSQGYSVAIRDGAETYTLTNLRFERNKAGRKNKFNVLLLATRERDGLAFESVMFADKEAQLID